MYKPSLTCFRKDLIVTETTNSETGAKNYWIKNPTTGEVFEFGQEEYFLCQSMDGTSTPSEIIATFKVRFNLSLTEADFNEFAKQVTTFGLLEPCNQPISVNNGHNGIAPKDKPLPTPLSSATTEAENSSYIQMYDELVQEDAQPQPKHHRRRPTRDRGPTYIWTLKNPHILFGHLAYLLKPLKGFSQLVCWALIPSLPIAFLTFFNNQDVLWQDVKVIEGAVSFLLHYAVNIITLNLIAKTTQAIVFTSCGGKVEKFGIVLTAGFFPRFYVSRNNMLQLQRREQLWTFASPLLFRLVAFTLGIVVWYANRNSGTSLGTWSLLLAHSAVFEFLIDGSPFLLADGYYLMVAALKLPQNFIRRVFTVWGMVLSRRPLPQALSTKEKVGLLTFGLLSVIWIVLFFVFITTSWSEGLSSTFHNIFGRGTEFIILGVLAFLALRKPLTRQFKSLRSAEVTEGPDAIAPSRSKNRNKKEFSYSAGVSKPKSNLWIKLLILAVVIVILLLPYPYRPGGQIQLLPPTQQEIQAQVEGKITRVFFKGGDSRWIKVGTVVAEMEAIDVENEVQITQEAIKKQQAEIAGQRAQLNKLLATPRPEDVAVARQQVEVARQQVEVARQQVGVIRSQLQTAINRAEFSAREAARFKELYTEGAYSVQQYENAEKQAEIDRNNIVEVQQNLAEAQQNVAARQQSLAETEANLRLVLSGPHPQEIEAARKDVDVAQAELKRLQQELKYSQEQIRRTQLLMPLDGHLITSYLDQKVGSYLKLGETFAVAEDNRLVRGEVQIPEYNANEFPLGAEVEVKLFAYPTTPIKGKVVSIEPNAFNLPSNTPTTSETTSEYNSISDERIVRVLVDIPNTQQTLKAGMTGYAKIKGSTKPVIVAFTLPIIRFVQIEVWSWLP